jgi:RNA polymerase sigma factor (sigma-70 family)
VSWRIPTSEGTSAVLLRRAWRGDANAVAVLLQDVLPPLRRWARSRLPRWVRAAADTSDVVQDAILRTLARLDVFQPRSRRALAAYLHSAVRNRIADEHRRAARWICVEATDTMRSSGRTPLEAAEDSETRRRYRAALAALSRRDRELVVAHLELEYSHAQLACMIGRSPKAARMALARAMARLAARMAVR